ncbi:MAG: peptidyl-prolyl cis-trans isomerase [Actinomycetota bacterium]|nr:peptidyl-prolyl cis-trans isomerase [Actinomycetota bacterium]
MPTDKRARQKEGRAARQQALLEAQRRQQRRSRILRFFIPVAILVAAAAFLSNRGGGSGGKAQKLSTTTTNLAAPPVKGKTLTGDTPCPPATGATSRVAKFAKAPPTCIDPAKSYTAVFDTSEGRIRVALDTKDAPQTANNFVVLARYHFYDGTKIFRTDPSIDIIQGGSPATQDNRDPGPGYTIQDEGNAATRKYSAGDLVMARTSRPNSGGAQFFFVAGPKAAGLDGGNGPTGGSYVTFGKTTQGLDVVQKILGLNKQDPTSGLGGAPAHTVLVRKVTIVEG